VFSCIARASQDFFFYAKWLHKTVTLQDGTLLFAELNVTEQELVEEYDSQRSSRELDRLLSMKHSPYRGAGAEAGRVSLLE
jgi:hypothetical protein